MHLEDAIIFLEKNPMYLFEKFINHYKMNKNFPDWIYEYVYEEAYKKISEEVKIDNNYLKKVFCKNEIDYYTQQDYVSFDIIFEKYSCAKNVKDFIMNNDKIISFILENIKKETHNNNIFIVQELEDMLLYVARDAEIEIYCDIIEQLGYEYIIKDNEIYIKTSS